MVLDVCLSQELSAVGPTALLRQHLVCLPIVHSSIIIYYCETARYGDQMRTCRLQPNGGPTKMARISACIRGSKR